MSDLLVETVAGKLGAVMTVNARLIRGAPAQDGRVICLSSAAAAVLDQAG